MSRLNGCFWSFVNAGLHSATGLLFKLITDLYFSQILLYRFLITAVILIPIVVYRKEPLFGDFEQNKWITLTAVLHSVSQAIRHLGMLLLPFADSFALYLSGTMLLTLMIGRCWLKETCGLLESVIAVAILCGIPMVTDLESIGKLFFVDEKNVTDTNTTILNQTDENWNIALILNPNTVNTDRTILVVKRLLGCTTSVFSCVLSSMACLCTRQIKQIHYSIINLHVIFWSILTCGVITAVFGEFSLPNGWKDAINLLSFGILGAGALITLYGALLNLEAGAVSTIKNIEIPISYFLQAVILSTFPSISVAIGSSIITVASFVFGVLTLKRAKLVNSDSFLDDQKLVNESTEKDRLVELQKFGS